MGEVSRPWIPDQVPNDGGGGGHGGGEKAKTRSFSLIFAHLSRGLGGLWGRDGRIWGWFSWVLSGWWEGMSGVGLGSGERGEEAEEAFHVVQGFQDALGFLPILVEIDVEAVGDVEEASDVLVEGGGHGCLGAACMLLR